VSPPGLDPAIGGSDGALAHSVAGRARHCAPPQQHGTGAGSRGGGGQVTDIADCPLVVVGAFLNLRQSRTSLGGPAGRRPAFAIREAFCCLASSSCLRTISSRCGRGERRQLAGTTELACCVAKSLRPRSARGLCELPRAGAVHAHGVIRGLPGRATRGRRRPPPPRTEGRARAAFREAARRR